MHHCRTALIAENPSFRRIAFPGAGIFHIPAKDAGARVTLRSSPWQRSGINHCFAACFGSTPGCKRRLPFFPL
jgi:hypothetical protein